MDRDDKNIVVIGAGYGGLTAALRLARLFRHSPDYRVHLVDKNPYHTLKTQLHEAAVHKRVVTIEIGRIIKGRNIVFHLGVVTGIDFSNRKIEMGGKVIDYEFLVLAFGSQANFYNIKGLQESALTLQTASDAEKIYHHVAGLCAQASSEPDRDRRKEMLRFVVGGGGLSGVEFAGELVEHVNEAARNFNLSSDETEVIAVEAAVELLPSSGKDLRDKVKKKLADKGVRILTGTRVTGVSPDAITLSTGQQLRSRTLVWTGGIRVSEVAGKSGIAIGESGRILVDQYLRSTTSPQLYAIGDSALAINPATSKPVPAAAQFALQQGRLVAENIFSAVKGTAQHPYHPRVWGEVVSLGRHLAVGWLALPGMMKLTFVGFLMSLLKAAIAEKHILLLTKESRNWVSY